MTTIASVPETVCLVRWVLKNGSAAIACEIDMNADRSFDVRAQPSLRSGRPIVEHFSGALQAMERHAEIANTLRDAGWRVAARTGEPQLAA